MSDFIYDTKLWNLPTLFIKKKLVSLSSQQKEYLFYKKKTYKLCYTKKKTINKNEKILKTQ